MFAYTMKKLAGDIRDIALDIDPDSNPEYREREQAVALRQLPEESGSGVVINLGNIFQQAKNMSRGQRRQNIRALLEGALGVNEVSAEDWMASLRLRARTPEEIAMRSHHQMLSGADESKPVTLGTGPIILELVADSSNHVEVVMEEQLENRQVTRDEALKMAVAALVRESDQQQWHSERDIHISCFSDDYDFARLLAAGSHCKLPILSGKPVAFAPSHSVCLVTDKHDEATVAAMVQVGNKMAENQRPLSHVLWTQDDEGAWIPYANVSDPVVNNIVSMQQVKETGSNYADQKSILEAQVEAGSEDIYVANYLAFVTADDTIKTLCAYTLNVPTYLPKTERVDVVDFDAGEALGQLSWDDFEAILGPDKLKLMPGHLPARYALTDALSDEQMAALRATVERS